MKQKKIGDILYVFDVTPYQITEDTDAEVIKVQEECVAGFKELNESLVDKIVAYNYHAMVAQVPVWAPYVDDVSPELAWSAESATVTIGADDNVFPTLTNPHGVTVTYSSSDTEKATIDQSTGQITLVAAGNTTISATFAGNDTYYEQTVTYALTVQEAQAQTYAITFGNGAEQYFSLIKTGGEANTEGTYTYNIGDQPNQEAGTYIKLFAANNDPTGITIDTPNVTFVDAATSYNSYPFWYFEMPAEDIEVTVTYTSSVKLTVTYTGETPDNVWPGLNAKSTWIAATIISGVEGNPQQGDVYEYTLDPGDEFEFDERNMYTDKSFTFSPELSQGTGEDLWGVGTPYVMPNTNVTAAVYTGTAPQTYTLRLDGYGFNDSNLRVDINRTQTSLVSLIDGVQIAFDTIIEVWLLTENASDYDTSSISTWMTLSTDGGLHYYANMPSEDKTINISVGTPD